MIDTSSASWFEVEAAEAKKAAEAQVAAASSPTEGKKKRRKKKKKAGSPDKDPPVRQQEEEADDAPESRRDTTLEAFRARAVAAFETEVARWEAARENRETGDDRYMRQVLKSGTLSDKVAAMTLLVQESPVHRFATLEALVGMAKSGKHAAKMAVESLKDLFGGGGDASGESPQHSTALLPGDRRLRARPVDEAWDHRTLRPSDAQLALWVFEEKLAALYKDFVTSVLENGLCRHQSADLRRHGVETAAALLERKPEQEARLLALVVNKLGDPDASVAARASAVLADLLRRHRRMTRVVAGEVQALAARASSTNDERATHRAVAFLSQVYLDAENLGTLAASLVDTYVALFRRAVSASASSSGGQQQQQQLKTRFVAALLAGLKRALPYCPRDAASASGFLVKDEGLDALFLASHAGTFQTRVQALALLDTISADVAAGRRRRAGDLDEDDRATKLRARFYRSLYDLLASSDVRKNTRPTLALNLCYRSVAADAEPVRRAALLKRLLGAAHHGHAALAAATVYLTARLDLVVGPEKSSSSRQQPQPVAKRRQRGLCGLDVDDAGSNTSPSGPPPGETPTSSSFEWRDALKREPLAAARLDPRPWEIAALSRHFHPSVRAFAAQCLKRDPALAQYPGDPLSDFSLSNFLDRFAYRNPKKKAAERATGVAARHAPARAALVQDGGLFDSYDFYAKYVRETAERAAAAAEAATRAAALNDDDDDDNLDDDLDDDDAGDFDDDLMDDDDDAFDDDDDDVDDDEDDDEDEEDDDDEDILGGAPVSAVDTTKGSPKRKKRSPFVDAESYADELKSGKSPPKKRRTHSSKSK